MALTIARLLHFERLAPKKFYLFDTFKGLVAEQISAREEELRAAYAGNYYSECYEDVKRTFAAYPNVEETTIGVLARRDRALSYTATGIVRFGEDTDFRLGFTFTDRTSNFPGLDYRRYFVTGGITYGG